MTVPGVFQVPPLKERTRIPMKTIRAIARHIAESLPDLSFRVDIIVRSRDVLEKRIKLGDWFLREATQKGKVLYERADD